MTVKDWLDFLISLLKIITWPMTLLVIGFFFRSEIEKLMSRLISSNILGTKMEFESNAKDYKDKIEALEATTNPQEQEKLTNEIIEPSNKSVTIEEGANMLAKTILKQLPKKFTLEDINKGFNNLFKKDDDSVNNVAILRFKAIVIASIRNNKEIIEVNNKGKLTFEKIVEI